MKLLLLSRYSRLGASSRLRSCQYLPYLRAKGMDVTVSPLFGDDYLKGLYGGKIPAHSVIRSYMARIDVMLRARQYDLIWLEKELLPWLPACLELAMLTRGIPLAVDYDDAIFHRYDRHKYPGVRWALGKKIDALMRRADLVIVGNDYLGDRARQAGARRVELLPTVVDTARYKTAGASKADGPVTIGWIGSPSTAPFLRILAPVLKEISSAQGARIVAIGANPDQLDGLPVESRPWREATEVSEIQKFDIGIMPLPDRPFERGKSGYKLIQYMACGKPVVASPVGVNRVIVSEGENGFLSDTPSKWARDLRGLCGDPALRERLGAAGRRMVEERYSLQAAAPRLEELLRSVL